MMKQGSDDLSTKLARFWKLYRAPIILGVVSILFIIVSILLLVKSVITTTPITFSHSTDEASGSGQASTIVVDIAGGIAKPGVYSLPAGSRVEDAIVAAGGLSDEADADLLAQIVNRAAKLSDGAKIYIPTLTGWNPANTVAGLHPVSINAASQQELETLTGIGPATAKKIISGRPYTDLSELVANKAMGQALFEKLKGQLTL